MSHQARLVLYIFVLLNQTMRFVQSRKIIVSINELFQAVDADGEINFLTKYIFRFNLLHTLN